jgi:hypothetical protein
MHGVVSHCGAADRESLGVKPEALVAVEAHHHVCRLSQPTLVMCAQPAQSFQAMILNGDRVGAQTKLRNAPDQEIVGWVSRLWLPSPDYS